MDHQTIPAQADRSDGYKHPMLHSSVHDSVMFSRLGGESERQYNTFAWLGLRNEWPDDGFQARKAKMNDTTTLLHGLEFLGGRR